MNRTIAHCHPQAFLGETEARRCTMNGHIGAAEAGHMASSCGVIRDSVTETDDVPSPRLAKHTLINVEESVAGRCALFP